MTPPADGLPGAIERFRDAYERDRTFTEVASSDQTGGPALTAHLLYVVRNDGQAVLDALAASEKRRVAAERECERLRGLWTEASELLQRGWAWDGEQWVVWPFAPYWREVLPV